MVTKHVQFVVNTTGTAEEVIDEILDDCTLFCLIRNQILDNYDCVSLIDEILSRLNTEDREIREQSENVCPELLDLRRKLVRIDTLLNKGK